MLIFINGLSDDFMKKYLGILLIVVLVSCKDKKVSLQDESTLDVGDFIEFFPAASAPYRIADSNLSRKVSDSLLIPGAVFNKFIPDSVLQKDFGKSAKVKIYPLGRIKEKGKGKETYLFLKAESGNKRAGYLAVFDEDQEYADQVQLVRTGFDRTTSAYGLLDAKFQVTTYREEKRPGNELKFKRNVYIFNTAANSLTLIMTEPNEEMIENVINPIDTLTKKNKFSGDYIKDKYNFVSVRDGRNANEYRFFVHFEKEKRECVGELKGRARVVSKTMARFEEAGNPCSIEFLFGATTVSMKEVGGCGTYRDIKCFFEGSYPKMKEAKPKTTPAKKGSE